MLKNRIVHLIHSDKFTEGFIRFVKEEFDEAQHLFFVIGENWNDKMQLDSYENIYFVRHVREFIWNYEYRKIITESDKVIINGVFGVEKIFVFFPINLVRTKMYMLFWGGDFYGIENHIPWHGVKKHLSRCCKKHIIKNAYGIITLVEGDLCELKSRVNFKGKEFVAPMASDRKSRELANEIVDVEKKVNPYYVIVGNSASPNNHHIDALELLGKFKDENIRVICPLSYAGDEKYIERVIAAGRNIFGDKFEPITHYIAKKEYFELLAKCTIGVYNNDRQQAMGNIVRILQYGAKVYMRSDTSMWAHMTDTKGYIMYDIEKLKESNFSEMITLNKIEAENNAERVKENRSISKAIIQWEKIFEDK